MALQVSSCLPQGIRVITKEAYAPIAVETQQTSALPCLMTVIQEEPDMVPVSVRSVPVAYSADPALAGQQLKVLSVRYPRFLLVVIESLAVARAEPVPAAVWLKGCSADPAIPGSGPAVPSVIAAFLRFADTALLI